MHKHKRSLRILTGLLTVSIIMSGVFTNGGMGKVYAENQEKIEREEIAEEESETVEECEPERNREETESEEAKEKTDLETEETETGVETEPGMETETETQKETETETEDEAETETETEIEEEGSLTLSAELGNLRVEATYGKGVLPEGTELVVKEISGQSYDKQLQEKANEQGRILTARKYYDVSFVLDGEEQEPREGSVGVRFYYDQSEKVQALSRKEIEAQAEKMDETAATVPADQAADVLVDGNVLKINGEDVLAVLGAEMTEEKVEEAIGKKADLRETRPEDGLKLADDPQVSLYHFDEGEVKEVDADIQTTGKNQIKEVNFDSASFSVYAVTITDSLQVKVVGNSDNWHRETEAITEEEKADKVISFINTLVSGGYSIVLAQDLKIPNDSRIVIQDKRKVTLYLNGYSISPLGTEARKGSPIVVQEKCGLTIKDRVDAEGVSVTPGIEKGTITGFRGAGVIEIVGKAATLNLAEGLFCGNQNGVVFTNKYDEKSTINLSGADFEGNKAWKGSVIWGQNVNIHITSGTFEGNSASDMGGVIYAVEGSTLSIEAGSFTGNSAARGGVLYMEKGTLDISGGTFAKNEANGGKENPETRWHEYGGGAIFSRADSTVISGTTEIADNWSYAGGGGVRINSGSFLMNGGTVRGNIASNNEGGGIFLHNCTGEIRKGTISGNKAGFNKDGSENNAFAHWGGGGIFCSQDATLVIRNARITGNEAYGFGGGITGCPTGRISINGEDGCALFGNKDYKDLGRKSPNLSGSESLKDYDHKYAASSPEFLAAGSSDFYSALNSSVSWKMKGNNGSIDANWKGIADDTVFDGKNKSASEKAKNLTANSRMGLTAQVGAIGREGFDVFIEENISRTHGGGILNNGYLIIGSTSEIVTGARIELTASKVLADKEEKAALEDQQFHFLLEEQNKEKNEGFTSTGTNDKEGTISFDNMIPLSEAGTYTYLLKEQKEADETIAYSAAVYKIVIETRKVTDTSPLLVVEEGKTAITKSHIQVVSIQVYDAEGKLLQDTFENADDSHACKLRLGSYEGEGELQATFVNTRISKENPDKEPTTPDDPETPKQPESSSGSGEKKSSEPSGSQEKTAEVKNVEVPVIPLYGDVLGEDRVPQSGEDTAQVLGEASPQTGDSTKVAGYLLAAVFAAGILAAYARKKKQNPHQ